MSTSIFSFRRWLTIPLIFGLILVLLVGGFGIRELLASRTLSNRLQELEEQGLAVSNDSLERNFKKATNQEGAAAWAEVFALVRARVNMFGTSSNEIANQPWGSDDFEWKDRELGSLFLKDMQPVFREVEKACDFPSPVWQPIHFQGVSTLLTPVQSARSVLDLLGLQVQLAIENSDSVQALRALRLMRKTADSFNWSCFAVSKLSNFSMEESLRAVVRRSLATDMWSGEQLEELISLIGPPGELENSWKQLVESELTVGLDFLSLGSDEGFVPEGGESIFAKANCLPTSRLSFLNAMLPWRNAGEIGLKGLEAKVVEIRNEQNYKPYLRNYESVFGSETWPSLASAYVRQEDSRRLTIVAVLLVQFQQRNSKWPDKLAELESIEAESAFVRTVDGQQLGYLLKDGSAYLWNTRDLSTAQYNSANKGTVENQEDFLMRVSQSKANQAVGQWVVLSAGNGSEK